MPTTRKDELGRNLNPFLGDNSKPANQTNRVACGEVWVTHELQQAARNFDNSWGRSLAEMLAESELHFVEIKFKDAGTKQKFFTALKPFADYYKPHLSSGVVPPDAGEANGVMLAMRTEFFLPDVFSEIVQDLAKTTLATISIKPTDHELAKLYSAAFIIPFVRFDLQMDEGSDQGIVGKLEQSLSYAQKQLVDFLKLLLAALPLENGHRVVVREVNKIEIDGELTEIKGAAKRALFALVLLRDKPVFNTKEFVQHFNGEPNPVEPRHDFDNAMKALRSVLGIDCETIGEGNRTVKNLQIRSMVDDAEIKNQLKLLYRT